VHKNTTLILVIHNNPLVQMSEPEHMRKMTVLPINEVYLSMWFLYDYKTASSPAHPTLM